MRCARPCARPARSRATRSPWARRRSRTDARMRHIGPGATVARATDTPRMPRGVTARNELGGTLVAGRGAHHGGSPGGSLKPGGHVRNGHGCRAPRRHVRPAAQRACCARAPGDRGARARHADRGRRRRGAAQAGRHGRRDAVPPGRGSVRGRPRRRALAARARPRKALRTRSTPRAGRTSATATSSSSSARDEFADFPDWREPHAILDAVASRSRDQARNRPGAHRRRRGAPRPSRPDRRVRARPAPGRHRATSASASRAASAWTTSSPKRSRSSSASSVSIELPCRRCSPRSQRPSDAARLRPADRRDRPGEAGDRHDDPRYAARVLVHGLLRHLHGREPAPDEVDLRRGALPHEGRTWS